MPIEPTSRTRSFRSASKALRVSILVYDHHLRKTSVSDGLIAGVRGESGSPRQRLTSLQQQARGHLTKGTFVRDTSAVLRVTSRQIREFLTRGSIFRQCCAEALTCCQTLKKLPPITFPTSASLKPCASSASAIAWKFASSPNPQV